VNKPVAVLLVWCGATNAAAPQCLETYQFKGANGVTVMAQSIPPEFARNGYRVVCPDGTLVREVPRQLTKQEIAERDRKLATQETERQQQIARAHDDAELARLYASADEIAGARDRKLRSIDATMAIAKANIEQLKLQKQKLEQQAADRERAGQLASPEILKNLQILDTQIVAKEREVERRSQEKEQVRVQFQRDIDRYEQLFPPHQDQQPAIKPASETVHPTAPTSGWSNPTSDSL
jgi:hypothetical protein